MPSFFSYHFGCRVNEAEKETLDRQMLEEKFNFQPDKPDIFIINTCAVTQKAEREARQLIYQTKRKSPKTKIIITGCAATYWQKNKLFQQLPIDLLVDNLNKEYLVKLIKKRYFAQPHPQGDFPSVILTPPKAEEESLANASFSNKLRDPSLPLRMTNRNTNKFLNSGRLLIKIQDGCQRFCTFCIVPYLRGLPKSLTIRQIVKQINNFTSKENQKEKVGVTSEVTLREADCGFSAEPRRREGITSDRIYFFNGGNFRRNLTNSININEVILTAINTEAFGYDTKEKFVDLIKAILEQTAIPRLSFGSIHPWSINKDFLNLYKKIQPLNRLVNFLHIPLQSGSNTILRLMKRGYTREKFLEKLKTIEKINPLTFISTDIIVGFLEETDKEFAETYKFLEQSPISKFHIFRFSKRQNTAAYFLAKKLREPSEQTKIKRAKALAELSKKKFLEFQRKNLGRTSTALILKKNPDGSYQGLLDNQLPVIIDSKSQKLSPSQIVKVKVTSLNKEIPHLTGALD